MDYFKIYNTLDSTNKEAQRLLAQGAGVNGLTLFAKHQTDGRGQLSRVWISGPGSHVAMSIIYLPDSLNISNLPALSMKTSLGIVNALTSIDPSLQPLIKWPNDIYAAGKKLCGILIENALSGGKIQHSIIGIGMNVNEKNFPPEISNAISLSQLTGSTYAPQQVALIIREHVMALLKVDNDHWKSDYDQYVFGKGNHFTFLSEESSFEAEVIGVSMQGHLILKNTDDTIKQYASHQVKWVVS
ncbi:MAG: biotin--[acetyl-CoA-carboxylase] ligase [Saprospiraceae bacterium]|nr:biotin--[acetyl-CoA-carboxylase] ligase [Saprospiraceae bacterium]